VAATPWQLEHLPLNTRHPAYKLPSAGKGVLISRAGWVLESFSVQLASNVNAASSRPMRKSCAFIVIRQFVVLVNQRMIEVFLHMSSLTPSSQVKHDVDQNVNTFDDYEPEIKFFSWLVHCICQLSMNDIEKSIASHGHVC
jgi:hypothetical protein